MQLTGNTLLPGPAIAIYKYYGAGPFSIVQIPPQCDENRKRFR
jgi:hypothetical protein